MAKINELLAVDVVAAGDLIPVYDASNGDARKASMTVLQTFMQDNLNFDLPDDFTTLRELTLVTGFSIQVTNGDDNIFLIMGGASSSTGTIVLPAFSGLADKQEVLVHASLTVTTLTLDKNGALSISGGPSTLAAGDFFKLRYDLTTTIWYRVS